METKDVEQKMVKRRLAEWGARIDVLEARARIFGNKTDLALDKQIDELRSFQRLARRRLAEFAASDDGAWKLLKAGIVAKWKHLRASFRKRTTRSRHSPRLHRSRPI
jgi:hypothetical protein